MKIKLFKKLRSGFTLIELMLVVAVIATLASISIPLYMDFIYRIEVKEAIVGVLTLEKKILVHQITNEKIPYDLAEVGESNYLDPWGNPYQYFDLSNLPPKVKPRADKNLNPINSDYDLYSMGKDGETAKQINASKGRDDIIRANDGSYVGLGENY